MKTIPLTKGHEAIVDDQDYNWLSQFKWHYSSGSIGYAIGRVYGETISMHRLIANPPAGLRADHVNGNGLDNRRANLRFATHKENLRNRKKHRNGKTSQYKGVRLLRGRSWTAQIRVDGIRLNLGTFPTEEAAARAYDQAAREHFGEFARCNSQEV